MHCAYVFSCLEVAARATISFHFLALGSKSLLIPGLVRPRTARRDIERLLHAAALADLDEGADHAEAGEPQVLEGARLARRVQEGVEEERDVGCKQVMVSCEASGKVKSGK